METLEDFVADIGTRPWSAWVKRKGFKNIYVRRGPVRMGAEWKTNFITLANMTASRPGNGAFTKLVSYLLELKRDVLVENILNPRLIAKLDREGWIRLNNELAPSYYKLAE